MRFKKLICFAIIMLILIISNNPTIKGFMQIPDHQIMIEGEKSNFSVGFPLSITVRANKQGIVEIDNNNGIKSESIGRAVINFKLFGLIPVKNVMLDIVPKKYVIVGGQPIGVRINTKGVVVVGFSDIIDISGKVSCPGKEAGIRIGDVLLKVNDSDIKDSDSIIDILKKSKNRIISLLVQRDERIIDLKVKPIKSKDDGEYKLGLWVRDHTSGIGTLTFVDPENNRFGALGHPITDMDTGQILNIKDGEIMHAHITSIQHGYKSRPGEIKGIFIEGRDNIGKIEKNTRYGIYGTLYDKSYVGMKLYPIGYQSQVKPGPAKILTTIENGQVKEYSIEIQKVVKQEQPNPKSMIIKITDPYLLKHTGGIIQGMSGSPIIQDGKLVGAVTHVFVNDPTRGYGIYIEWMLDELNKK